MAQKLYEQDDAARLLNVSVDELNSMRDRKQIFPKRDGGVWKYGQDEIDRVLRDREAGGSGSWGDSLSLEDVSLELNSDPDSILLADSDIGDAGDNPSTIIGRTKDNPASQSDVLVAGMQSPKKGSPQATDSDLFADLTSMSDVRLASESGISLDRPPKTGGSVIAGTGMGSGLLDDLVLEPTGSSAKMMGSGALQIADEQLNLSETDSDRRRRGIDHDTKKGGSAIQLTEDDDDLVLGGSGSDITIGGDSGISLVDPHDSGLSLEEPLELESSNIESLDLGEDDMISLEEDVDLEGATQLRSDADFLLTPMDDAVDESDSGSQVIALDADEEFGAGFGSSPGMLEEDLGGSPLGSAALVGGAALATGPALMPASYAAPEAPYSIWNILSLLACVVFLIFGGMFMYDLIRHMWSWGTPYTINSSMMDSLIAMFEK